MAEPPMANPANPRVKISTSMGDITVELFEKEAPICTANFLKYVNADFYEGLVFHRVIKGFMIQGGGMDASGKPKKGNSAIKLEINYPTLQHWDVALAMARTSEPNSATSQFYICHGAQKGLDKNYAVFGVVREGRSVVDKIATSPTDRTDKPKNDITIQSTTVL